MAQTVAKKKLDLITENTSEKDSDLGGSYIESESKPKDQCKTLSELNFCQSYDVINMMCDTSTMIEQSKEFKEAPRSYTITATIEDNEPEERLSKAFYVRNIDTGEVFDTRKPKEFQKIDSAPKKRANSCMLQEVPWKQYW